MTMPILNAGAEGASSIVLEGAGGIRLRLLQRGSPQGRPVIFLHGITENASAFDPLLRALPGHLRPMALDLRGRGRSFKPESGYRLSDYMADLLIVCNGLSGYAERPVLVGHSMGARIAAAFAATYPDMAGGAVLIDPPLSGPGRAAFPLPLSRFVDPKKAIDEGRYDDFRSYYTSSGFDYERKALELQACALPAIEQSYAAMNAEPFHAYYRMLRLPALLVAAGLAPFISEDAEEELRAMNPGVRTERYADVGHEVHKLAPERLLSTLTAFIASLS
ncbi:alpha/beta fold hydrolase [Cohnella sp. JJ-181]|uniref:alpha/beta fold hydrolase n=1 Tax=Cohnella rhizoplanae TaxID=2974897 RepID=UPI0022FF8C9B|nr:alpha/beta fold hydrolase [Cohnella sp. JJ-181]CAI6025363.1 N-formylmaleamate deformylase [Cohnella sp. JJ-181]